MTDRFGINIYHADDITYVKVPAVPRVGEIMQVDDDQFEVVGVTYEIASEQYRSVSIWTERASYD